MATPDKRMLKVQLVEDGDAGLYDNAGSFDSSSWKFSYDPCSYAQVGQRGPLPFIQVAGSRPRPAMGITTVYKH